MSNSTIRRIVRSPVTREIVLLLVRRLLFASGPAATVMIRLAGTDQPEGIATAIVEALAWGATLAEAAHTTTRKVRQARATEPTEPAQ
jgi:hypothetical protein